MTDEAAPDAPVTRDEINRLWTNQLMLEQFVGYMGRWSPAEIERWHARAAAALDDRPMDDELARANLLRAAGRLADLMRRAARDRPAGRA